VVELVEILAMAVAVAVLEDTAHRLALRVVVLRLSLL
jgi:hypothetical protein